MEPLYPEAIIPFVLVPPLDPTFPRPVLTSVTSVQAVPFQSSTRAGEGPGPYPVAAKAAV